MVTEAILDHLRFAAVILYVNAMPRGPTGSQRRGERNVLHFVSHQRNPGIPDSCVAFLIFGMKWRCQ